MSRLFVDNFHKSLLRRRATYSNGLLEARCFRTSSVTSFSAKRVCNPTPACKRLLAAWPLALRAARSHRPLLPNALASNHPSAKQMPKTIIYVAPTVTTVQIQPSRYYIYLAPDKLNSRLSLMLLQLPKLPSHFWPGQWKLRLPFLHMTFHRNATSPAHFRLRLRLALVSLNQVLAHNLHLQIILLACQQ